jgi:hypothetical protein
MGISFRIVDGFFACAITPAQPGAADPSMAAQILADYAERFNSRFKAAQLCVFSNIFML